MKNICSVAQCQLVRMPSCLILIHLMACHARLVAHKAKGCSSDHRSYKQGTTIATRELKAPDTYFSLATLLLLSRQKYRVPSRCLINPGREKKNCDLWRAILMSKGRSMDSVVFILHRTTYVHFVWVERNVRMIKNIQQHCCSSM